MSDGNAPTLKNLERSEVSSALGDSEAAPSPPGEAKAFAVQRVQLFALQLPLRPLAWGNTPWTKE